MNPGIVLPVLPQFFSGSLVSIDSVGSPLNPAALFSTIIFILVFIAISFQLLHETAAAMLGAAAMLVLTYVGGNAHPFMYILTFEEAMDAVDWNVIFLIMGMMTYMAILAETNVFRWLAIRLYQASRGNTWMLTVSLLLLTGITSALLNDVTVILLLVPLSIQLALAIGIHPYTLVIPEVLISNIGGAATLIGNPPSTIVGSHIGISFVRYMANMLPIVLLCTVAVILVVRWLYREELTGEVNTESAALMDKLRSDSQIANPNTLRKAIVIGCFIMIGFVTADQFNNMPPGGRRFQRGRTSHRLGSTGYEPDDPRGGLDHAAVLYRPFCGGWGDGGHRRNPVAGDANRRHRRAERGSRRLAHCMGIRSRIRDCCQHPLHRRSPSRSGLPDPDCSRSRLQRDYLLGAGVGRRSRRQCNHPWVSPEHCCDRSAGTSRVPPQLQTLRS